MALSTTIVGAGPAGSTTAKAILDEDPDHNVTLVDMHTNPWSLVQCAGGMSASLLDTVDLNIPKKIIVANAERVVLNTPHQTLEISGRSIGRRVLGIVVDRAAFDRWLFDCAVEAGAKPMLGTKVTDAMVSSGGGIRHINIKIGKDVFIPSEYLVGADGARSLVGKWFDVHDGNNELHMGYQETWDFPDYPQDAITVWFNRNWAPSGYCWAFPGGNKKVRVGIGIPLGSGNIRRCFNKFITECDYIRSSLPESGEDRLGGLISTGPPLKTCVNDTGNVALVGCAGRHTSSLHGGGILHGIIAGQELGKTIGKGEPLKNYDKRWKAKLGRRLKMHYKLKRMICSYSNDDFDRLCAVLSDFELKSNNIDGEFLRFIKHVLSKDPGLVPSFVQGLVK